MFTSNVVCQPILSNACGTTDVHNVFPGELLGIAETAED